MDYFDFKILNELHVFKAFIYEVLRIAAVGPTGLPHFTTKKHNINVNGKEYVIPAGCFCHQNTYYMQKYLDWANHNKPLNEENNDIHLEYWLDENGKFKMNQNFILFGVGKRDCVGKGLAMKAIFAMYGILLQKYKFSAPNNDPNSINIKQRWGLVQKIDPPIAILVTKR